MADPNPLMQIESKRRMNLPSTPRGVLTFPNMGKRTVRDIAAATVPARATWVVAAMALAMAVGLHTVNLAVHSPRLTTYAHMFEFMPFWLLIGGSLHQVGSRIVQAWDDLKAWRQA